MIIGGMMSWPHHYERMRQTLAELNGVSETEIPIVPLHPTDWGKLFRLEGWNRTLAKVEQSLDEHTARTGKPVLLIGHSLGGVIGKLLTDYIEINSQRYSAAEAIAAVVGLGSPFRSRRVDRTLKFSELTSHSEPSGLGIRCLGVAGNAIHGKLKGSFSERWAYQAYKWHIGRGDCQGDQLIPEPAVLIDGVEPLQLEGVYHERFVHVNWYGSPEAVHKWWPRVVELLNNHS